MTDTEKQKTKPRSAAEVRKAKLAAELRANLMKRKAQARARRAGEADHRQGMSAEEGGSET